jgi:hypothetical protein
MSRVRLKPAMGKFMSFLVSYGPTALWDEDAFLSCFGGSVEVKIPGKDTAWCIQRVWIPLKKIVQTKQWMQNWNWNKLKRTETTVSQRGKRWVQQAAAKTYVAQCTRIPRSTRMCADICGWLVLGKTRQRGLCWFRRHKRFQQQETRTWFGFIMYFCKGPKENIQGKSWHARELNYIW